MMASPLQPRAYAGHTSVHLHALVGESDGAERHAVHDVLVAGERLALRVGAAG
jgi:hypothetical protein